MRVGVTPTSQPTFGRSKRCEVQVAPATILYAKLWQRIEHAGYKRYVLQRNPPRYDPDGDVVEPDDEYDDDDDLEVVEENPYADIRLERVYQNCAVRIG